MNHTNDLGSRLNEHYGGMSKGQRLLAAYITDHYDRAVFLTAAKLGEEVGVSESTVVRFASMLGYKGYPQFQRALEEMVRGKLDAVHKMEAVYGGSSQSEILDNILRSDALRIKNTLEEIDAHAFESAVDTILQADTIYVAGLRSCAPLAEFHTSSASELFEQMVHIGERDVIIGISFPRYSMRTLKALEFANNRNARVITITDSIHSPMNLYSSCNLLAKSDMSSILDSLVAPLSVINALLVALCMKKQQDVVRTLDTLERIWDDYQVFGNDEIDYMEDGVRMHYANLGETDE